jgi:hypothetical protein
MRETHSGAHRDHNGVLGEDGDGLERPDHCEGGGGGAPTVRGEDDGYTGVPGGRGGCEQPSRCAGVRRLRWSCLRGWRWLDGGNGERRSFGGGGNREKEKLDDGAQSL